MRFNSRIAATAFRAVARAFGEPVRIIPIVADEYRDAMLDPERPAVTTRATVSLTPVVEDFDGARQGAGVATNTRFAMREASIWFPPHVYAAIGYGLRYGDRVTFPERPGEPPYSVAREPVFSDRGDVFVELVQEGRK